MRKLKFMQVCPDDDYFIWQVHMWLESLRNIGHSDKAISLIFTPKGRQRSMKWKKLIEIYTEAEFHFYSDEHNITKSLSTYIPVLRPYTLWRYFQDFPETGNDAVLYCDADVIFTENFNVDHLLDDNICYLSDTRSYISAKYFDSKVNDVLPEKKEEYEKRDILAEACAISGLERETCDNNVLNSGGAQYLLKNLTASFWAKVTGDCLAIKTHLGAVNKEFFPNESKGFQSWCADMWAVLWNIWVREMDTRVVKEMDFAWATDSIEKLERVGILHNAGITSLQMDGKPVFYKGKYHSGGDPTKDKHFWDVLENKDTSKLCTWHYAKHLATVKEKYNLNY